ELPHRSPPSPADLRRGNRAPARLAVDFRVGKQIPRVRIQKNRIRADAVLDEGRFQLRPDWRVPLLVLRLAAGVNGHPERNAHQFSLPTIASAAMADELTV